MSSKDDRTFLWDLLDDIDTANDQAKANDRLFREIVNLLHPRRFERAKSDGYSLTWRAPQPRSTEGAEAVEREGLVERLNQVAAALDRRAVIHDGSGLPRLGDGLRQEAITVREAARALASPAEGSEPPLAEDTLYDELVAEHRRRQAEARESFMDEIRRAEAETDDFLRRQREAAATERPAQGEAESERWVCPSCRVVMCYDPGMICPCCGTTMDRRAERAEPNGALGCVKCGSADIHTRYRAKGERLDVDNWREDATEECLRRYCRGCQYRWTDSVLASAPQRAGTEGEAKR